MTTAKIVSELSPIEDPAEVWEDEGGALGLADRRLTAQETAASRSQCFEGNPTAEQAVSTVEQGEWADQIRARVAAEFDRVAKVLGSVASKQPDQTRMDTQAVIAILEQKRGEVLARNEVGSFLHDWQELRDEVRQMILQDPRCQEIRASQAVPRE